MARTASWATNSYPTPGEVGATGPSGTSGASGATGPSGTTGPSGVPGVPGTTGPSGVSGVPGLPGATGATGPGVTQTAFASIPTAAIGGSLASIIGGPISVTVTAGQKIMVWGSGQFVNSGGSPSAVVVELLIDAANVQQPVIQVPPRIGVIDGATFAVTFETGALLAGAHSIDLQASAAAAGNEVLTGGLQVAVTST